MVHVIRTFDRPAVELVELIKPFPPSTLHEAQGRSGALTSRIKPIYPGMRACGPALTVRGYHRNGGRHRADADAARRAAGLDVMSRGRTTCRS
jgi:regulator of RNase E activity RraA